ncbi:shikimate dehydrogenase family protein [Halpernia frigidisoli]|uniref:Shikimate dehydrogenase n=1 Tax=Halpernia frigidisoli TaxID=1125876 RepID=A0A1I3CY68_9FLAO|nr:shikimate dehydrogenase [Halpernia frigidisoli]SFH79383.1 shikimate dehydrogenase [Halpernia frigidisoli]
MIEKQLFGLIGKNISYSFSKKYFTDKFKKLHLQNKIYEIFDLNDISEVEDFFLNPEIKGLNVTIPFKEKVIPFLDELSDEAKEIGAVNCIAIKNGTKTGHNTDAFGFEKTLLLHLKDFHKNALILGNGGAAKAVKYILKKHNIPFKTVARNTDLNFENLTADEVVNSNLIIQCTPVGTFPNESDCLKFPFNSLTEKHLVIDLIYNPTYTQFLKNAAEFNAKTLNGYYMLEQQAEKAWEIWNSK